MDYHYDDNTFKKLSRRHRFLWIVVLVAFVIFIIVGFIIYDGLTAKTVVTETAPESQTLGQTVQQKVFDEETYTLTTDPTWSEIEVRDDEFVQRRYHSVENGLVVRDLAIYVNKYPDDLPVTHVVPVEINGNKLIPLGISPNCDTLQETKSNKVDITVSWAGVKFLCDPDLNAYLATASHNETGVGIELGGTFSDATYFFVYRDLETLSRPTEFQELLRNFEAK